MRKTRNRKSPPMGGALRAYGPSGQDMGGQPPMIPPALLHRCNCRRGNYVIDVEQATIFRKTVDA